MNKYKVVMVDAYTREVLETDDEIFDSEDEAQDFANEWGDAFSAGAECLSLAGEEYTRREDVDFEIVEIDE